MATIQEAGKKRVFFFKRTASGDIRETAMFSSEEMKKGGAKDKWLVEMARKFAPDSKASLHSLFKRYVAEVSKYKRGKKAVQSEGQFFERLSDAEYGFFKQDRAIGSVTEKQIEQYIEERLEEVTAATVHRDFNTLRDFFRQCASKKVGSKGCWKLLQVNPCDNVAVPNPKSSKPGVYILPEWRGEFRAAAQDDQERVMADIFDFAIETGLRRGEIVSLTAANVRGKILTLFDGTTKNGSGRDVPLTPRARAIWAQYPDGFPVRDAQWITFTTRTMAKRIRRKFTFHHCRHTAATDHGNSGKFSAFELMRWFGWADIKTAMIYVKTHVETMADRFDPSPAPKAAPRLRLAA